MLCSLVLALLAAPVRVTFARTMHPAHDLHADSVAVVYAIGDNDHVTQFVDDLVAYAGRAGTMHIENAVDGNEHLGGFNGKTLLQLRKQHPAGAYIGVSLFTCAGEERNGEVGDVNAAGDRIRRKVRWLDAVCIAKLDIRAPSGKQIVTFMTHGDGTSPRVPSLGADEREIAFEQATRFAAISAAEGIAPREVRESIELDERAPSFDDGAAMLDSDRLADARAIWEAALTRHRDSAALQYDLGAVCEALGDVAAAERYYQAAVAIAPADPRYRTELRQFRKRNGLATR